MHIHETSGRRRTYRFSIDDDAPLRKMFKHELARMYFPLAATDKSASDSLRYLLERARQDKGHLSDYDAHLCRDDGMIYLFDVLKDLGYSVCAQMITADQVAAILHFLGPFPDEEDLMPEA